MDPRERAQAWLAFASAAVCGQSSWTDGEGGVLSIEDIGANSEDIADDMLEAYERRFGDKPARTPRTRRRKEEDR